MNDDHNLANRMRLLAERAINDMRADGGVEGKKTADEALRSCEEAARGGHRKYSETVYSGMKARAWVDAFFAAFKARFEGSGLRVVVYESGCGSDLDELLEKPAPADVRAVVINAEVSW